MQKVSYMGNGSRTEFTFNFPYFEASDIIVRVNDQPAPPYNIVGASGGLDADFPYTGGKVVFETPPARLDNITIARQLPQQRQYDYQPTVKIDPTTLNQDMNYLMEVLKDLQDELDGLRAQYADIADKDSTEVLLAKMQEIHNEIVAVNAQIIALGDISTLRQDVTTNGENITTLNTRTTGLLDYVIESQAPTAENNYTWYRKYKSGWVECGGIQTGSTTVSFGNAGNLGTINLPFEMQDANYYANASCKAYLSLADVVKTSTTTTFLFTPYQIARTLSNVIWEVKGYIA